MGLKRKHTIMCNASYLYIYIEISRNSLISFFSLSLLTSVITENERKEQNSDALKHTINNSFMVTVQNVCVDFFLLLSFIRR